MGIGFTHVKFFVFGEIPRDFVNKVLNIVRDFIGTVDNIDYLEVYFYRSAEEKLAFLESEAQELGVIAVGDFIAMHEAWRGWPRVHIDYEKSSSLCDRYLRAVVVHEVSHAILHGSPIYYSIAITQDALADLDLDIEDTAKLVYLASTIVKDIDVHGFLVDVGMANIVEDYLSFLIERYSDIDCKNIEDVLQLAKILTPCIFIEKCLMLDSLPKKCVDLAYRALDILKMFKNRRLGDLSEDVVLALRQIIELIKSKTGNTYLERG